MRLPQAQKSRELLNQNIATYPGKILAKRKKRKIYFYTVAIVDGSKRNRKAKIKPRKKENLVKGVFTIEEFKISIF